ncbi:hypothetical protein PspLS_10432 [Pyricularia sp. CBS 133598]|nr:hypothetical protein PspLS_10432 [Pyricularia sp. CBS 133598]
MRCDLFRAKPGQALRLVHASDKASPASHKHLSWCYGLLEEGGLINLERKDGVIVGAKRTATKITLARPAAELQTAIKAVDPSFEALTRLIYLAGTQLAEAWMGKIDAVPAIFGSVEGRKTLDAIYGPAHVCVTFHRLMEDFISRVLKGLKGGSSASLGSEKLRVLELGAGTGGTTKWLAPCLAAGGVPALYTFSDLAPGFCSQAAREYAPIVEASGGVLEMAFTPLDIEAPPPPELKGTQHIVMAVNAVHATPDVTKSLANLRGYLRPGGIALIMELSQPIHSADFVFGLFDGWWSWQDGDGRDQRNHATAGPEVWDAAFRNAGFTDVEWTAGETPEADVMRVYLGINPE